MRPTRVMGLAGLSIAMLGVNANAEIESEFHAGYSTDYVFRGVQVGRDLYEYGFNLSGESNCGLDWHAGIWYANIDKDNNGTGLDEELDIYGGVSKELGAGTVEVGFIRYIFPDAAAGAGDQTELYLSYGTSLNAIDLGATLYYTVAGSGFDPGTTYFELTADYSMDVAENVTLDLGLNFGYLLEEDDSGSAAGGIFSDNYYTLGASAALNFALSEDLTFTTYIAGELTEDDTNTDGDDLYGGASVSFAF